MDFASVPDLTAHFRIERGNIENDSGFIFHRHHLRTVAGTRNSSKPTKRVSLDVSILEAAMISFFCAARARARCSSIQTTPKPAGGHSTLARSQPSIQSSRAENKVS